jgi:SAM-dependent methyltransferase
MRDVTEHDRKYWQYEYDVVERYIVPLLVHWRARIKNALVIDVGCAEGGGLCALHDHGAHCVGFDIDQERVELAEQLKGDRTVTFLSGNLYDVYPPFSDRQFDLVVLHDVFEHLDDKVTMVKKLKRYMKPDGKLLITFPPYYSAYGAHQQHLRAPFAKIPFFHLIPFTMTFLLPRLRGEHPPFVQEIQKLGRLKMGMRQFEKLAERGRLRIVGKEAYLISPNHIRFGLKPIPAGPIARIPILREFLCTGVVYLLAKS